MSTGQVSNVAEKLEIKSNQMAENMKEQAADSNFELHKDQALDPDQPIGERIKAGVQAVGDKIEVAEHKLKEEYYDLQAEQQDKKFVKEERSVAATQKLEETIGGNPEQEDTILAGITDGAAQLQAIGDKAYEMAAKMKADEAAAQLEIHKAQLLNENEPLANRVTAAAQIVGDSLEGLSARAAEQYYKNK